MTTFKTKAKAWFFRRYKLTKQSIGITVLCVVIFGLTLYFMNVMANVASYLSPDITEVPKLSDRLFDALPSIQELWLTDLADLLMFLPTILLVLSHYRPLYLLCKVLLTWGLCNLMRITTVAITSFPDPRDGCVHSSSEFFTSFTLHRCGDSMFSGHTIIFVISALVWTSHGFHRFPRRLRWLAFIVVGLVWLLCIGAALIVIANRAHYTVDVLVAFYIAAGNWYWMTYMFDHYIEEKDRLEDLTRPWGTGPDPRSYIQERKANGQPIKRRRKRNDEDDDDLEANREDDEDRFVASGLAPPLPPAEVIIISPSGRVDGQVNEHLPKLPPQSLFTFMNEDGQDEREGDAIDLSAVHYVPDSQWNEKTGTEEDENSNTMSVIDEHLHHQSEPRNNDATEQDMENAKVV